MQTEPEKDTASAVSFLSWEDAVQSTQFETIQLSVQIVNQKNRFMINI